MRFQKECDLPFPLGQSTLKQGDGFSDTKPVDVLSRITEVAHPGAHVPCHHPTLKEALCGQEAFIGAQAIHCAKDQCPG